MNKIQKKERIIFLFSSPWVSIEGVADLQVHGPVRADEHVVRRAVDQHGRHPAPPLAGNQPTLRPKNPKPEPPANPRTRENPPKKIEPFSWPQKMENLS